MNYHVPAELHINFIHSFSNAQNYQFNGVYINIEAEHNDLVRALTKLKSLRTLGHSLLNDAIDTTIDQARKLINELVEQKSLSMSADKALPILTAHIDQICTTIEYPTVTQINELNKSIVDLQKNLLHPMSTSSKWANRTIAALLMLIGVSLILSVLVLGPVLLSIGVSTLVADLIFGGALPALMLGTFTGVCSALFLEHIEKKVKVNNVITLFGKSSKEVLTSVEQISIPHIPV